MLETVRQASQFRKPSELKELVGSVQDPASILAHLTTKGLLESSIKHTQAAHDAHAQAKPLADLHVHLTEFREATSLKYFSTLTNLVQSYLVTYTKFKKFEMTSEFEIHVDGRGLWTFSGGERDLICTVLRIAIGKVVAEARFGRMPIAIFDSSFDALDDRALLTALECLRDTDIDRIIVTTHRPLPSIMGINMVNL
jgi:DNA repair exonuclease SbcCD ATPase subunit